MSYEYEKGGITFRRNDDGSLERVDKPKQITLSSKAKEVLNRPKVNNSIRVPKEEKQEQPIATEEQIEVEKVQSNMFDKISNPILKNYLKLLVNPANIWNLKDNYREDVLEGKEETIKYLEEKNILNEQIQDLKLDATASKETYKQEKDYLQDSWLEGFLGLQSAQEKAYQDLFQKTNALDFNVQQLQQLELIKSQAKESGISEGQINEILTASTSQTDWSKIALMGAGVIALALFLKR